MAREQHGSARRRALFPPPWIMPIFVVLGIVAIWMVSSLLGAVGAVVGIALIVWFQKRADAYVRLRSSSED